MRIEPYSLRKPKIVINHVLVPNTVIYASMYDMDSKSHQVRRECVGQGKR
jgi:hypothetical protein